MKIEYRRLTEKELNTFIDMRIKQLREEGAKEDIDLVPALKQYYIRHMGDGCPSGKIGLLSSMFTDPDYRRKGIAKELLTRVVHDAKEYGCGTVQITASDMGVKLYSNFGFVPNKNFMQYKLS